MNRRLRKQRARQGTEGKRQTLLHRIGSHLLGKLVAVSLLIIALGLVFVLVLGALSIYTPEIVAHMVSGSEELDFLSADEKSHIDDVHGVVAGGMKVVLLALLVVVIVSMHRTLGKADFRQAFIMSLVLLALLIPFNYTFTWFHHAFFPQGNWQFPVDSWLITHYSPMFFAVWGVMWFGGASALLALLSRVLKE
jgi:hypothetical protein